MDHRVIEAVQLFEDILIYGTSRILKNVESDIWKDYSPEQIQMLKLIKKEKEITSNRLAELQGVHKSAVSNRLKKLLEKRVVDMVTSTDDQRSKIIVLTSKGEEVLEQSNEALYKYIEKLFIDQVEDVQIDQFIMLLNKIKSILQVGE
ncbi:MarR family winged helix-turn-helix transcriptional regulator [Bacillaceae bacterium W0354]